MFKAILIISIFLVTVQDSKKTILFFGDSLTAGNGISPANAFPALIQEKIDSLGLSYSVINAGLSGETSAGGLRRINWVLQKPVDIFILELGANDGLRGVKLNDTEKNLQQIIDIVREKNPSVKIVLAGMKVPPNMGPVYEQQFDRLFPKLAKKNETALIPFLLKNVGGIKELNQSDQIHPTEAGHQIVAKTVWETLYPLL
ncbi:MAG: arylesterase [Calditrichaeota bacterium]|nr:arylesterase [Calditrichota bacterium]